VLGMAGTAAGSSDAVARARKANGTATGKAVRQPAKRTSKRTAAGARA
jgi:hypothetical protein